MIPRLINNFGLRFAPHIPVVAKKSLVNSVTNNIFRDSLYAFSVTPQTRYFSKHIIRETPGFTGDPAVVSKLIEEQRKIHKAAEAMVISIKADPKFQADPKGYIKAWEDAHFEWQKIDESRDNPKLQADPNSHIMSLMTRKKTRKKSKPLDEPKSRAIDILKLEIADLEMRERADKAIEDVKNNPVFRVNPKAYIDAWVKRRGYTEEFRMPEDMVLGYFTASCRYPVLNLLFRDPYLAEREPVVFP